MSYISCLLSSAKTEVVQRNAARWCQSSGSAIDVSVTLQVLFLPLSPSHFSALSLRSELLCQIFHLLFCEDLW